MRAVFLFAHPVRLFVPPARGAMRGRSRRARAGRDNGRMSETPPTHPTELDRLLDAVARFRGEGGCAWYESQTHASLVPYLIEETAELVEALEADSPADIREELGDVLFQVLFHADVAAQRADEDGRFDLEDVARAQREKLERRNPHVFGDEPTRELPRIIALWEAAKAAEKAHRTSVLDGIPAPLEGIARASKVLGRAAPLGLGAADAAQAAPSAEDRLGEELLGLVERGRIDGLDPDRALRLAVRRLEDAVRAAEAGGAHPGTSAR